MERVYINEYHTEDGYAIYRVCKQQGHDDPEEPADCTNNGGFFYYRDNLDEFLEENADDVEVVHDYRSEPD